MRSARACSLLSGIVSLLGANAYTPSTVPDDTTFRETDAAPRDENLRSEATRPGGRDPTRTVRTVIEEP
jgi:hypothetical protein